MTKLSIITICYNEPHLELTLKSIVEQTYQDFEWIVIDGGSNQETLDIFEKYKYRINTFICEKDNGIYDAYNKGLRLAKGEYVNFMNAGDSFYNKNVLKNFIKSNPKSDLIYSDFNMVYSNVSKIINLPKTITKLFFIKGNINTQALFCKKELFEELGQFDTKYKIASDYDRWIYFFTNQKTFEYFPNIITNYDANGISSNKKYIKTHIKERNEIISKYYTEDEIVQSKDLKKINYSLPERIFSIKNNTLKTHKIITIFNMRIKIKQKRKRI